MDLRDIPTPQFVELVETNPEVTSAFIPYPGPLTFRHPSTGSGAKLKDRGGMDEEQSNDCDCN